MDTLEICYMSAGDLSKLVQNKEISPVEIIEAHLTRIDATEPVLNSFITLLADEARGAALQAEKDIQAGRYKGPLHGIPVALKDLYNTGGVRTTSGSRIFDNFIPTEDCTVAAKFQQAGAILVGKLNMHPFAYGPTGENLDYGHMHNPWNPDMVTGGSSGGAGSCSWPVHYHHWQRHWRLHTDTCRSLRYRWPQAHLRVGQSSRSHRTFMVVRSPRANDPNRGRRGNHHECHCRS